MHKRIAAFFISVIMMFSFTVTANAEYNQEILFNGIPWGSTYQEVTTALAEQYNVSFTAPEYEYYQPVRIFNPPKEYPFSFATGFTVHSNHAVTIADLPAYIVLHFVFPNDGMNVLNEDINGAIFNEASYRFWSNKKAEDASLFPEVQRLSYRDAFDKAKELAIKLETIYGESDNDKSISSAKRSGASLYKVNGLNDSMINFGTGDIIVGAGSSSISLTYSSGDQDLGANLEASKKILQEQALDYKIKQAEQQLQEQEEKKQEQDAHEQEIANGNKNGL